MSISQLFIIAAFAFLIGRLKTGRPLALLGVSTFMIYWLQPAQEQITLTFWLPTATLVITGFAWLLTSTPEVRGWKQNLPAAAVLLTVILFVDLNRYIQMESILIAATPRPQWIVAALAILIILGFTLARWNQFPPVLFILAAIGIILLFILVKVPSAFSVLFETLSAMRGKESSGTIRFSWLGFSYVSFRLLHTILDRRSGRLPSVPLADYVNYVIFFPSFTAGPVDRLERFIRDLNEPLLPRREDWIEIGRRFFLGLFKKFVIADALAWIALNETFAAQVGSAAWMWFLLYCYSLRIYFDFAGYTDIAIGMARMLGVRLPENFASPYLKPNLTQFWNSWHMTLMQWFRSYFFNPLTRLMRSHDHSMPVPVMLLIAQVSTMVLIGLWHGVTAGFVLWGLWHGMGLFIQNRWSAYMKNHLPGWGYTLAGQRALTLAGVFLTFNFVSLGWLFFTLPTPAGVWNVLAILFGVP
jgi:D-alanyl-lipoteichoic acid acyltransferase DltB (MBOAT superfamily)